MLTLERLYGSPLTDLEAIKAVTAGGVSRRGGAGAGAGSGSGDPEEILITALNTWFGSVLACESFHADVHAGNLLVRRTDRLPCVCVTRASHVEDTCISRVFHVCDMCVTRV